MLLGISAEGFSCFSAAWLGGIFLLAAWEFDEKAASMARMIVRCLMVSPLSYVSVDMDSPLSYVSVDNVLITGNVKTEKKTGTEVDLDEKTGTEVDLIVFEVPYYCMAIDLSAC